MINFYKMHYELDSFFSVSSFKLHFISAKFEDFFADLETLAPTTSTQKQRGTVKCNSAATFCFSEQKISRGKKIPIPRSQFANLSFQNRSSTTVTKFFMV